MEDVLEETLKYNSNELRNRTKRKKRYTYQIYIYKRFSGRKLLKINKKSTIFKSSNLSF